MTTKHCGASGPRAVYVEIVSIFPCREFFAVACELCATQGQPQYFVGGASNSETGTEVIDDHAAARIILACAIRAGAVHARRVTQIFDGSRRQQGFPCGFACGGPVRHIQQQIVIIAAATPARESAGRSRSADRFASHEN